MKFFDFIKKLNLNIKLASLAIFFGVTAFLISDPFDNGSSTISTKDLAVMVQSEVDHVNVEDLADWIIKGKADYRLVDIRPEKEFNEYNLPGSENILITNLLESDLMRNEKIILYSDGGVHSAQAWFLLKAKDYKNVYMLRGGMDEWKDKILFPKLSATATEDEKAKFGIASAISRYFGGTPQIVSGDQTATSVAVQPSTPVAPKIQAPAGSSSGGAKKKKREGC